MNKRKDNPFTLTFGKQPFKQIARYEENETIVSTFDSEHPISQAYLIEGLRGSGKTVLMTTVANTLSKDDTWMIVNLNSSVDLLTDFAMRLTDVCRKTPNLLRKGFQFTIGGFGFGVNGDQQMPDPVGIISELLKQVKKKGKKVLITIDEVRHNESMCIFASQFQIFIREDAPVYLLMTGLHENIEEIINDPALTFLLRSPKMKIEPLSLLQIRRQYKEIFSIDDVMAGELAVITKGYAFAFQALGMVYWENRENKTLEEILEILDEMLDDFVYKKIWSTLTEKERIIVHAMQDEDTPVKDIYTKISMQPGSFAKYRDTMLEKGVIESNRHGYIAPVLPRFCEIAKMYRV